jgi:predicted phage tail protein
VTWAAPAGIKTGFNIQVLNLVGGVVRTDTITNGAATSATLTGLTNGQTYTFKVRAFNAGGNGPYSAASNQVRVATVPGAPTTGAVTQGPVGGNRTLTVNWAAPGGTGGTPITSYTVRRVQLTTTAANSAQIGPFVFTTVAATARSLTTGNLAPGNYRFSVVATNAVGNSPRSVTSANGIPR